MAWTNINSEVYAVGQPTQSVAFAAAVVENLSWLKANMSSAGGGGNLIPNGDFEQDVNLDGIPDGWDLTEYTAGAGAIDTTTPGQGAKGYKFTSPGASGGGELQSTEFFAVSPGKILAVDFLHWASNVAMNNKVTIRFYTTALEANFIEEITLYDSVANPTSITRFISLVTPSSTGRFAKLKIVGGDTSTTEVGVAYFDNISVTQTDKGLLHATIAEVAALPASHTDTGTCTLSLPTLSANGIARITFCAEGYAGSGGIGSIQFTLGAYSSNIIGDITDAAYARKGSFEIVYLGTGGDVTLTMTVIDSAESANGAFGRMVAEPVCIEILTP